jgi:hypothetical protein
MTEGTFTYFDPLESSEQLDGKCFHGYLKELRIQIVSCKVVMLSCKYSRNTKAGLDIAATRHQ